MSLWKPWPSCLPSLKRVRPFFSLQGLKSVKTQSFFQYLNSCPPHFLLSLSYLYPLHLFCPLSLLRPRRCFVIIKKGLKTRKTQGLLQFITPTSLNPIFIFHLKSGSYLTLSFISLSFSSFLYFSFSLSLFLTESLSLFK